MLVSAGQQGGLAGFKAMNVAKQMRDEGFRSVLGSTRALVQEAFPTGRRVGARFRQIDHKDLDGILAHPDPAIAMANMCRGLGMPFRKATTGIRRGWVCALNLKVKAAAQFVTTAECASLRASLLFEAPTSSDGELNLLRAFLSVLNDQARPGLAFAAAAAAAGDAKCVHVAAVLSRTANWLLGDFAAFDRIGRTASPSESCRRMQLATMVDRSVEAAVELQQLRIPMAVRLSQGVIERTTHFRQPGPVSLLPSIVLAQVSYEHGDLAEADAAIRSILPRIRAEGMPEIAIRAYTTLARSAVRRGRFEFASMMLSEGEALGLERGWPRLTATCLGERIDMVASRGMLEETRAAFERLERLYRPGELLGVAGGGVAIHLELARCQLRALEGVRDGEAQVVQGFLVEALARGDLLLAAKLAVRLVAALMREGNEIAASAMMVKVVTVACHAGLFQTILDGEPALAELLLRIEPKLRAPHLKSYVATLLEHWKEPVRCESMEKGKKRSEGGLTPREQNVLQLMSYGHSNKRVAQLLGIAPETVKSHAKNIFARLGSSSRTEAVSRAASLGMI